MLLQLTINNYAIIDHLTIQPSPKLNIVTGETGAGKSIILGALSLILGERADTSVLINKEVKCVVEATFDIEGNLGFLKALAETDIDQEPQCIIRREINHHGKSRAFVNDTPVTLQTLSTLTHFLVDLHRQFDHHTIDDAQFQFEVVDSLAQNEAILQDYQSIYKAYSQLKELHAKKIAQQLQLQQESDYKNFLLEELENAQFSENEIEETEVLLKQAASSERIVQTLGQLYLTLEGGEDTLNSSLKRQLQSLQQLSDTYPPSIVLQERLQSALIELKDIASEADQLHQTIHFDQEKIALLEDRLNIGHKLLKKHGVQRTEDLLNIQKELSLNLQSSDQLASEITSLATEIDSLFSKLTQKGAQLSELRKAAARVIERDVQNLLHEVGMPNAAFRINLQKGNAQQPSLMGLDTIQFELDANKSGYFQNVGKAASGGELSRIALCIKSLIARAIHLPTLIFDEVDTGISGEVAKKVAQLLSNLAQFHQVICITHQVQVAAKGEQHYFVYKEVTNDDAIKTQLKVLTPDEKIIKIAQMIDGESPSKIAILNAQSLIASN